MRTTRKLTPRQRDVLGVVGNIGPASVGAVDISLNWRQSSTRGVLDRLEKRALIAASYAPYAPQGGRFVREYSITDEGAEALNTELETES